MAALPLHRIDIEAGVAQRLAARQMITARHVLACPELDLMEMGLSQREIDALLPAVAAAVLPPRRTALDLVKVKQLRASHLAMQLTGLDALLRGGCPCGGITELVGPAGVGKTQLCLQLTVIAAALDAAQPGSQAGTVCYIDAERRFSAKRVHEMAAARFPQLNSDPASLAALMSRIQVVTPTSSSGLLQRLEALEQGEAQRSRVRLVVVDSVAALVRNEADRAADSAAILGRQASVFKSLATRCNIPVVVSNQVTRVFRHSRHDFDPSPATAIPTGGLLTAALGPQWAHAVNTRLVLEASGGGTGGGTRWIKVAKSPVSPQVALAYEIGTSGLQLLNREPVSNAALGSSLAMPISSLSF